MKLIAESGSTKCDWMRVGGQGGVCRTQGINAALHTPEQIRQALDELPPEFVGDRAGVSEEPLRVIFYGAGAGESFPAASEVLRGLLSKRFGTSQVEVHSDLLAAARALLGREEGIACILGTGSNSCRYDGGRIVQNVSPLGYVLGDEGSGAVLGCRLLNGLLKGALSEELKQQFYDTYELTYEAVIRRVYREPQANRFLASLVPFIRENMEAAGMRELVREAFREFVERNLTRYPKARVSFTGGVAAAFESELRDVMAEAEYEVGRIEASPVRGLIEYHERE